MPPAKTMLTNAAPWLIFHRALKLVRSGSNKAGVAILPSWYHIEMIEELAIAITTEILKVTNKPMRV